MTKANIAQYSTTAADNTDINDISLAENVMKPPAVNNAMREQMAQLAQWTGEGTIASASTMDIGAEAEEFLNVTGTTTVTALGTVRAGTKRRLLFAGALTLTHNATSLILLGGVSRTTAAGDIGVYVSEGSGNWREVSYERASGGAFVQNFEADEVSTDTFEDKSTGDTVGSEYVVHGSAKAWLDLDGVTPNVRDSLNISSIGDNGTGDYTSNFTNNFATTNRNVNFGGGVNSTTSASVISEFGAGTQARGAGYQRVFNRALLGGTGGSNAIDALYCNQAFFGDLA